MHEDVVAASAFVEVIGGTAAVLAYGAAGGSVEPDYGDGALVAETVFRIIDVDVIAAGVAVEVAFDVGEMATAFVGAEFVGASVDGNGRGNGIGA